METSDQFHQVQHFLVAIHITSSQSMQDCLFDLFICHDNTIATGQKGSNIFGCGNVVGVVRKGATGNNNVPRMEASRRISVLSDWCKAEMYSSSFTSPTGPMGCSNLINMLLVSMECSVWVCFQFQTTTTAHTHTQAEPQNQNLSNPHHSRVRTGRLSERS